MRVNSNKSIVNKNSPGLSETELEILKKKLKLSQRELDELIDSRGSVKSRHFFGKALNQIKHN